jgi:aryl-alcohol dehydrogenase-like predicted oxidoreductase
LERVDTLGLLAKELGMSLPQYAIKSLQDLSDVRSTIVGIKNIKQIEEFSQLI